jgi:hypothetical protein
MGKVSTVVTARTATAIFALIAIAGIGALEYLRNTPTPPGQGWLIAGAVLVLLILGVVLLGLGRQTDIFRDSAPTDFGNARGLDDRPLRRPFSLAQVQMAWWFYLVFAAWVYLLLTTGNYNTITAQALTLMGIGTGTALGAVAIEKTKTSPKLQRLQLLVQQVNNAPADKPNLYQQPLTDLARQLASQDFFTDILTDVDGVCLHRFQMMVWTVVLGGVFVAGVLQKGEMPQFDPKLLALLGLSGGAYLGFKIPETPA